MPLPGFAEGFIAFLASRSMDWKDWEIWVGSSKPDFESGDFLIKVQCSDDCLVLHSPYSAESYPRPFETVCDFFRSPKKYSKDSLLKLKEKIHSNPFVIRRASQ